MSIANWWRSIEIISCLSASQWQRKKYTQWIRSTQTLSFRQESVIIERQEQGIPLIKAGTESGGYFGQGYVMACDRLWQMDLLRRTAKGELAALLGVNALASDRYHASLWLTEMAQASLQEVDQRSFELLTDFCAGINYFIDSTRRYPWRLPIEYRLLKVVPKAWEMVDSQVILKLLALELAATNKYKALMTELNQEYGVDEFQKFFLQKNEADYITQTNKQRDQEQTISQAKVHKNHCIPIGVLTLLQQQKPIDFLGGSAWVVKDSTGKATLANNLHALLSVPDLLYQSQINVDDTVSYWQLNGVSVPGIPAALSGHNAVIAWGMTNAMADVQDLWFISKSHLNRQTGYFTPRQEQHCIAVLDGDDYVLSREMTSLGPSLQEWVVGCPQDHYCIYAWSGLQPGVDLEGLFSIVRAQDWPCFRVGLSAITSLAVNFLFASHDGDIALRTTGNIPLRQMDASHHMVHFRPWLGMIPFDALPEIINPKSQQIIHANNPLMGDEYSYQIETIWQSSYRAERIAEQLNDLEAPPLEQHWKILQDRLNNRAQRLLPTLLQYAERADVSTTSNIIIELLQVWNYQDNFYLAQPWIWQQWIDGIESRLLGNFLYQYRHLHPNIMGVIDGCLLQYQKQFKSACMVDVGEVITSAFRSMVDKGIKEWGSDPKKWRYAKISCRRYHDYFDVFSSYLSVFQPMISEPVHGGESSIEHQQLDVSRGKVTKGTLWRMVVSFDEQGSHSFSQLLSGISGDHRSPWYQDHLPRLAEHSQPIVCQLQRQSAFKIVNNLKRQPIYVRVG